MNIWIFLLNFIKKNKVLFISSMIAAMLPSIISAATKTYYAKLIAFIGTNPKEAFTQPSFKILFIMFLCYASQDILQSIKIYIDTRMKIRYQRITHNEVFRHTHKHSAHFFNTEQSGVITAKSSNLIHSIFSLFSDIRGHFLPTIAYFLTAIVLLANINIFLMLCIITVNISTCLINYFNTKSLKTYSQTCAREESKLSGVMVDSIANARLVKNSGILPHEKLSLRKQINCLFRAEVIRSQKLGQTTSINGGILTIAAIINYLVILAFYCHFTLSIENIILAVTFAGELNKRLFDLAEYGIIMQNTFGRINDAMSLLYRPFDITDAQNAKKLTVNKNNNTIEIKNVNFAYNNGRKVLHNINLSIGKNEKIGLIGRSGSGKSTLINLLLRSIEPTKGKIYISDTNITKVTQFSLQQNIAFIPQEPNLFNRSIMENIRFSRPKATDEEVFKAAKLAHIHDTILKMPNGYNSVIGERGVKLSGGERQRITIAAAILKDTPILILDEATSALDSESEAAIEKALKNIMKNKTVIAIAHRLSTLKNMDRIIVLDNGKIAENGTEKELLKNKDGIFSRLYHLQSDGYLQVD